MSGSYKNRQGNTPAHVQDMGNDSCGRDCVGSVGTMKSSKGGIGNSSTGSINNNKSNKHMAEDVNKNKKGVKSTGNSLTDSRDM